MSGLTPDNLGFSGSFGGDLSDLWNLRLDPTGQGSYASIEEDRQAYQDRLRRRQAATGNIGDNPDLDPAQMEERNRKIRESMRGQQGYASNILSMGSGPNTDYGKRSSSMLEIAPQIMPVTSEVTSPTTVNTRNKRQIVDRQKGRASEILGPNRWSGPVRIGP